MRRLPIYFLIDVSESMVGEPIEMVQNGIRSVIQELRTDPYALETVFVSVIAFAGKAKTLIPLTELFKFYPPALPIGSGTSLGCVMDFLMNDIDSSVQKTTSAVKGDWKPIVFLFTDGVPTDNPESAFQKWNEKYRRNCSIVAVSIGDNADTQLLGKITDNVLKLKKTDEISFKAFFKWITASIKTSSVSVAECSSDELKLPPLNGINLEKVNTKQVHRVDENFAVVVGRCQTTKKLYLVKYAKRIKPMEIEGLDRFGVAEFKLVGAYPIEEESYKMLSDDSQMNRNINTAELRGVPTCPCCGNQLGFVVCECGGIFCVGDEAYNKCPWCGLEGVLGEGGAGGMDVNRARG